MSAGALERCECGLELPRGDAPMPMHDYIGATASCWALYSELHAKQYQGFGARTPVRVIDAYCVQHHGAQERRAIQSVNVHLVALYLQLEKGYVGNQVNVAIQRILCFADQFKWLDPPTPNGTLTVADILKADTPQAEADAIEAYARDIWQAWRAHRETAMKWAKKAEGK
jgi:hypothetical protein